MIKYIIFICLLLTSCYTPNGKPSSIKTASYSDSQKTFEVAKLFTVDSITIYRFYDKGEYHYFSNNGDFCKSPKSEQAPYAE